MIKNLKSTNTTILKAVKRSFNRPAHTNALKMKSSVALPKL